MYGSGIGDLYEVDGLRSVWTRVRKEYNSNY